MCADSQHPCGTTTAGRFPARSQEPQTGTRSETAAYVACLGSSARPHTTHGTGISNAFGRAYLGPVREQPGRRSRSNAVLIRAIAVPAAQVVLCQALSCAGGLRVPTLHQPRWRLRQPGGHLSVAHPCPTRGATNVAARHAELFARCAKADRLTHGHISPRGVCPPRLDPQSPWTHIVGGAAQCALRPVPGGGPPCGSRRSAWDPLWHEGGAVLQDSESQAVPLRAHLPLRALWPGRRPGPERSTQPCLARRGAAQHRYRQSGGNRPGDAPGERAGSGEVHGLAQVLLDELRRQHRNIGSDCHRR